MRVVNDCWGRGHSGSRNRAIIKSLLLIAVTLISAGMGVNIIGPEEDLAHPFNQKAILFFLFVIFFGVLLPAIIALAVVYMASIEEKPSEKVAAIISWSARQTYDVFLLHPLVLILLFTVFPPSTWFFAGDSASTMSFFAFGALTLTLSVLGGYLQRAMCSVCMAQLSALTNAALSRGLGFKG